MCGSVNNYLVSHDAEEHAPAAGGRAGVRKCVSVTSVSSLPQIDMFILGYALEVKIKVFRLFKFNCRDFEVCYPEEPLRDWPEISLLTEDDLHYHIPVF